MNKMERMKELIALLNEASKAYYAEDKEIMSNYEYDALYDELVALEEETGTVFSDSPTVNVGYEALSELPKERHETPMLSLGKTKDREEIREWLLDKETEGLLLMTNDGDLIQRLMRGTEHQEKEYIVKVTKELPADFKEKMESGVFLSELNRRTKPCQVEILGKYTFRIILTQGLNRQIRRMCQELGLKVNALQRVRVANITLGKLRPGTFRRVNGEELQELYRMIGR